MCRSVEEKSFYHFIDSALESSDGFKTILVYILRLVLSVAALQIARLQKGFLRYPTPANPVGEALPTHGATGVLRPINKQFGFSKHGDESTIPFVAVLFPFLNPPTVFGEVAFVVVDPI